MMFTTALTFALLPALALAQYGPPPGPAPGPTTSAAPAVPSAPPNTPGQINVNVAANLQFVFSPANFTAANGTLVTFFFPNNGLTHSVTQSSFANPCIHLAATGNNSAGFDSGLQAGVQFTINITDDSQPIWFHCKQQSHCGMGMVGSINAPSSGNTFDKFQAAALAIGPSEALETDSGPVTGGVNGVATAPPSAGSPAPAGAAAGSSQKTSGSMLVAAFVAAVVAVSV